MFRSVPAVVFVLALFPLLPFLSPAVAAAELPARARDTAIGIVYARVDTVDLKLDLYRPSVPQRPGFLRSLFLDSAARDSLDRASGPRPLLLWLHGGGWRGGSRGDPSPALPFLDSGYAVANVDYRLSTQALWPAQLHDAKAAVRWLRARADSLGLDTARFVAWGTSAGGHLAAMLGVTSGAAGLEGAVGGDSGVGSGVRAVVDYYGAADFLEPNPRRWTRRSSVGQLLGCAVADCPDRAWLASPVAYVTPDDPPFFIVHGTRDSTVPFSQSVVLDSSLRAAGVPVTFVPLPGVGHGGATFTAGDLPARVRAFLDGAFMRRPPGEGRFIPKDSATVMTPPSGR